MLQKYSRYFYIVNIIFLAVVSLSLIFRDDYLLTGRPFTEDAYYSFTVARNLALGNGFTVGNEGKTNGFQPLFTLIASVAYLFTNGDKFFSLRIILFIQWIIYILTAVLLGIITKNSIKNITIFNDTDVNMLSITSYIYISCISVFLIHLNGLETGLLLLLYTLLWYLYQKDFINNIKNLFIYSLLLGLLVLTRIDTVFFVILFSLSQFFKSKALFKEKFIRFSIVSATSFLVSLPWWLYNYICFGSFIPTSGLAQQSWSINYVRVREANIALSQNLMPLVYMGTATLEGVMSNIIRICLIILSFFILFRIWKINRKEFADNNNWQRTIQFVKLILISMLILILYYTFSFYATWFYFRYFAPLILISVFFIGMIFNYLIFKIPKLKIMMVIFLIPVSVSVYLLWHGKYPNEYYIHQFALVNDYVPRNEYVGAFQSGTLGYFYDNTINLDGKMNIDAIKYKNNLIEYVERKNIKWLCDWKWKIEDLINKKLDKENDKWIRIDEKGKFLLVKKNEF